MALMGQDANQGKTGQKKAPPKAGLESERF
jgi:hypothetical protein